MGVLLDLEFLLFGGLLLFFPPVSPNNECSASFCSNYTFPIRFPFQLMGEIQQPQYCGYPGFNLTCTNQGDLILNLPYSGDFSVRDIDYLNQEMRLFDPQGCLTARLLNLNLSSSPFLSSYYHDYYDYKKNYTFLVCPPQPQLLVTSGFTLIDCLSNSTVSVLATSDDVLAKSMNSCSIVATVPIAFSSSSFSSDSDIYVDLFLSWNVPNCKNCESRAGTCQMGSNAQDILCSDAPSPREKGTKTPYQYYLSFSVRNMTNYRKYIYITGSHPGFLRVIGFTIFLPFVVLPALFIGILCCKYMLITREQQNRADAIINHLRLSAEADDNNNNTRAARAAAIISQITNQTRGLDDSIIQSYPKLILDDESRNIPGKNIDLICPICLAEYRRGDQLQCIPKCDHYFHADCIDEWLRIKITCPVCRTVPSDYAVQNP